MNELEHFLSDESFQRWLDGTASTEEVAEWQAWLKSSIENEEILEMARAIWKSTDVSFMSSPDSQTAFNKLQQRLQLKQNADRENETAAILPMTSRSRRFSWQRFAPMAIAASLLLALGWQLGVFEQQGETNFATLQTGFGQRKELTLPEGSKIILNANSTLKYPAEWNAKTPRHFELSGEAFFEVVDRPEGPQDDFIVYTEDGFVSVLGTQFVVADRGAGTRVVLVEGKVEAGSFGQQQNRASFLAKTEMKPGQLLEFEFGSKLLSLMNVDVLPYTSWYQKRLVFRSTPFADIIKRLEETFGANITVTDSDLLDLTFSGSIENTSLQVIARSLAESLNLSVKQDSLNVIFDK